jgi:hypothetical protein
LEFDADFETRLEQTVWDLQEQVTELKEMLRKEQDETRAQVMQNLAKMQGIMLQTVSAPALFLAACCDRPLLSTTYAGWPAAIPTGAEGNP